MRANQMLSAVSEIAGNAGRSILPFFRREVFPQPKADKSLVTEVELAARQFLVEALGDLSPHLAVLSEESSCGETVVNRPGEDYWLVDPLDGTKGFIKGKTDFTVNIALIRERRPVLGVVHAPALGLTYLAEAGKGAWRQTGRGPVGQIRSRPADFHRLTVVVGKDPSGPRVKRLLEKLPSPGVTSIGSSLNFGSVLI